MKRKYEGIIIEYSSQKLKIPYIHHGLYGNVVHVPYYGIYWYKGLLHDIKYAKFKDRKVFIPTEERPNLTKVLPFCKKCIVSSAVMEFDDREFMTGKDYIRERKKRYEERHGRY